MKKKSDSVKKSIDFPKEIASEIKLLIDKEIFENFSDAIVYMAAWYLNYIGDVAKMIESNASRIDQLEMEEDDE